MEVFKQMEAECEIWVDGKVESVRSFKYLRIYLSGDGNMVAEISEMARKGR